MMSLLMEWRQTAGRLPTAKSDSVALVVAVTEWRHNLGYSGALYNYWLPTQLSLAAVWLGRARLESSLPRDGQP